MSPSFIVLFALVAVAAANLKVTPQPDGKMHVVDEKGVCTMCTPFADGKCTCADLAALRCQLNSLRLKLETVATISASAAEIHEVKAISHAILPKH